MDRCSTACFAHTHDALVKLAPLWSRLSVVVPLVDRQAESARVGL